MTRAIELAIDKYLRSKGIDPKPNPGEAAGQGDRIIDGARAEYKTISGVRTPTADALSGAIANRAMNARSQATNIIIDARNQTGMSESIAKRGIIRAFAADSKEALAAHELPKIETIRVILKDSAGGETDILVLRS